MLKTQLSKNSHCMEIQQRRKKIDNSNVNAKIIPNFCFSVFNNETVKIPDSIYESPSEFSKRNGERNRKIDFPDRIMNYGISKYPSFKTAKSTGREFICRV